MRDIDRRLVALESRIVRHGPRYDFTSISADDLAFVETCGRAGDVLALSAADASRLELILLRAGRTEGSA